MSRDWLIILTAYDTPVGFNVKLTLILRVYVCVRVRVPRSLGNYNTNLHIRSFFITNFRFSITYFFAYFDIIQIFKSEKLDFQEYKNPYILKKKLLLNLSWFICLKEKRVFFKKSLELSNEKSNCSAKIAIMQNESSYNL